MACWCASGPHEGIRVRENCGANADLGRMPHNGGSGRSQSSTVGGDGFSLAMLGRHGHGLPLGFASPGTQTPLTRMAQCAASCRVDDVAAVRFGWRAGRASWAPLRACRGRTRRRAFQDDLFAKRRTHCSGRCTSLRMSEEDHGGNGADRVLREREESPEWLQYFQRTSGRKAKGGYEEPVVPIADQDASVASNDAPSASSATEPGTATTSTTTTRAPETLFRSPSLEAYAVSAECTYLRTASRPVQIQYVDYKEVWYTAMSSQKVLEARGLFARGDVCVLRNFADFEELDPKVSRRLAPAEEARLKAELVYRATGMPAIAEVTTFEIEPNPGSSTSRRYFFSRYGRPGEAAQDVDALMEKLRPISEVRRQTHFITTFVFYDGERVLQTSGKLNADIAVATSAFYTNSASVALIKLLEKMIDRLGLEAEVYDPAEEEREDTEEIYPPIGPRTDADLEEDAGEMGAEMLGVRLFREARVLANGRLDVSRFLGANAEAELMHECALNLMGRFDSVQATKILTVEALGTAAAMMLSETLEVPLVHAADISEGRAEGADLLSLSVPASADAPQRCLGIERDCLGPDDCVLIIGDFMAGGTVLETLSRLVRAAGADVAGVGVLIERRGYHGRERLARFRVDVESLVEVEFSKTQRLKVYVEDALFEETELPGANSGGEIMGDGASDWEV
eukprot:ctg_481.g195